MTSLLETCFWLAALLLAWTYAGYPVLIWAWARLRSPAKCHQRITPLVSILIIARNEQACICRKLDNLLALQYPRDLLDIVVASDASTDATVTLVHTYAAAGVRVVEFARHRGKPAVLNEVLPSLRGGIVVLMDARQTVNADAVQCLVDKFADPRVGAASGELHLLVPGTDTVDPAGTGYYWRYEKFIRRQESRVDSTVGVTGALYALRRELFESIPEDTLLDDVLIPMQVVRKGYRVLFEPGAQAYDTLSPTAAQEFRRKVRTIAGNFQLLSRHRWLLDPRVNRLWFQTLSHKLCRLLSPACLLLVLASSLLLSGQPLYRVLLILQLLFYAAALAGHLSPVGANRRIWCSVPHAFCLLNWSTAVGFVRFIRGQQQVTWQQH